MRFFIPGANDIAHAEQLYRQTRDQVTGTMGVVSDRRICRIKFRRAERTMNAAVGSPFSDGTGSIFAIYETESGFVVCTSAYGKPKIEEAVRIPADSILDIEEFSAIA
jgi:hypothetical protein